MSMNILVKTVFKIYHPIFHEYESQRGVRLNPRSPSGPAPEISLFLWMARTPKTNTVCTKISTSVYAPKTAIAMGHF